MSGFRLMHVLFESHQKSGTLIGKKWGIKWVAEEGKNLCSVALDNSQKAKQRTPKPSLINYENVEQTPAFEGAWIYPPDNAEVTTEGIRALANDQDYYSVPLSMIGGPAGQAFFISNG